MIIRTLGGLALLAGFAAHADTVTYVHTDALGSPVLETDASGGVVRTVDYRPYGEEVLDAPQDGPAFTGHYRDAGTGLVYMQQRYYDPAVGRFVSGDPVGASAATGTNFNRYWYANGNPYAFVDPDGMYARGSGFSDKQWERFDRAQQRAAKLLEAKADKIEAALQSGDGLKGVTRSFERAFGKGSGTRENMGNMASNMKAMAAALRDTGPSATPANAVTTAQLNARDGKDHSGTLAAVPSGGAEVLVNISHPQFTSKSKLRWAAGHESAHQVLGFSDRPFGPTSTKAYKHGSADQLKAYQGLTSPQTLTNPDRITDYTQ